MCAPVNDICIIIPVYNHAASVCQVVEQVLPYGYPVFVVDDGSTDGTAACLETLPSAVTVLRYARNKGKGYALKTGFKAALATGFTHAVTLDADGQHRAADILPLVEAAGRQPLAVIVGSRGFTHENMPGGNRFANRFSNFWFWIQTGCRLSDTQTGFRIYPLRDLPGRFLIPHRYEAELWLLVWAAWHGRPLVEVPVRVHYPPTGERVSHFRPVKDFVRISVLNTVLCIGMVVYAWPLRLARAVKRRMR